MKEIAEQRVAELVARYPQLAGLRAEVAEAAGALIAAYRGGHRVLVCGNGGSAADALHIVGELMKAFVCPRKVTAAWQEKLSACPHSKYITENLQMALPAVSLVSEAGLLTAYANDVAPDMNFAQQVFGQ